MSRALMWLASQETARTNAAEASADLRKRRREQDAVDAYLHSMRRTNLTSAEVLALRSCFTVAFHRRAPGPSARSSTS